MMNSTTKGEQALKPTESGDNQQDAEDMGPWGQRALGLYFVGTSLLLLYLLAKIFPGGSGEISLFWGRWESSPGPEVNLILIVAVSAGLGSYVHAATSFADFVGNRKLKRSWTWWYVLRLFIGVALALVFYFAVRGGLMAGGATADDMNPFGVAAVGGLTGMFSRQATDKLADLFDTLFSTQDGVERKDELPKREDASEPSSPARHRR